MSEIHVNAVTEDMIAMGVIDTMFNDIAYLDPETVRHNLELGCEGGMNKSDRAISSDLALYLMRHFGFIYMGLISNEQFRMLFREAVEEEMTLDDVSEETLRTIRKDMAKGETLFGKAKFVINFSKYDEKTWNTFSHMFAESLDAIQPWHKEVDELTNELDDDAKIEIGFCISNFMYLIRAFSKNPAFANTVKEIIDGFKATFETEESVAEPDPSTFE